MAMKINDKNVLVTGGAGFIGSHVVDALEARGASVTVFDNLSTGRKEFLRHTAAEFVKGDCTKINELRKSMRGADAVFHVAANADIRGGVRNTRVDLEQNTLATYNVLEAMRLAGVKRIAYSSSSAAYGEPKKFPTPEDYPLAPTSLYGASKVAGEALVEAFSSSFGFHYWIYRYVSILGERYSHGSVYDFYKKMLSNPRRIEILGNGRQRKSYFYVGDCARAMAHTVEKGRPNEVYNIGSEKTLTPVQVADIVADEMGLGTVAYSFTGGERGWIGDQKVVLLDTRRLLATGFKPRVGIEEAIRRTVDYLKDSPSLLERGNKANREPHAPRAPRR